MKYRATAFMRNGSVHESDLFDANGTEEEYEERLGDALADYKTFRMPLKNGFVILLLDAVAAVQIDRVEGPVEERKPSLAEQADALVAGKSE